MATTVLDTPDQISTARLMALKQAVKLEGLGMRHSSGKSMRRQAARELGLSARATTDEVFGALSREIDKRLKALASEPAASGNSMQEQAHANPT